MTRDTAAYVAIAALVIVVALLAYRLLQQTKEAGAIHINGRQTIFFDPHHLAQVLLFIRQHVDEPRSL